MLSWSSGSDLVLSWSSGSGSDLVSVGAAAAAVTWCSVLSGSDLVLSSHEAQDLVRVELSLVVKAVTERWREHLIENCFPSQ